MLPRTLATLCLVAVVALAGCLGGATADTDQSPTNGSPTDDVGTDTGTEGSPTTTLAHSTGTDGGDAPAEPARLPSTADCLTDAVPSPNVTAGVDDSLQGRAYPATPANTTAPEAIGDYAAAFEEAYLYNGLLHEEDAEDPLRRATSQVTRVNLTRIDGGYLVRVEGLGATTHESGVHGDYGISAVYRFTPDTIERSPRVEQGERAFEPVVAC